MVQARRASRDYNVDLPGPLSPKLRRQNSQSPARQNSQSTSQSPPTSPKEKRTLKRGTSSASLHSASSIVSNASLSIRKRGIKAARMLVKLNWNVLRPFTIALIPTACAVIMKWYQINDPDALPDGFFPESEVAYSTLSWILGIVLVFRTGQSYNRYWDGATNMILMKTELCDACGQITSFAESSNVDRRKIDAFQLSIVRLFSLLHGCALQQVADNEDEDIKVIDHCGLDPEQMHFMRKYNRKLRTDIVMQWIVRTITEGVKIGVVDTPAPLVSRVLEEANAALIALARMRAVADIPFPVPYAMMVSILLVSFTVLTPFFCVTFADTLFWAGMFSFVPVFSLWSIQFIAKELESPFGNGVDDLDLPGAQSHYNDCLMSLLHPQTQWTPDLDEVAQSPKCVMMSRNRASVAPQSLFLGLESARVTRSRSDLSSRSHHSRWSGVTHSSSGRNSALQLDISRMTRSSLDLDSIQHSLGVESLVSVSNGESDESSPVTSNDESLAGGKISGKKVLGTQLSNNESLSQLEPRQATSGGWKPRRRSEPDLNLPTNVISIGPEDPPGILKRSNSESFTQQWRRHQQRLETILSQPEPPAENGDSNEEDAIVTQRENQNHHDEKINGFELRKSKSSSASGSNDRTNKLDELLQNNHHCLALFKAGLTSNDADVQHNQTGKLSGRSHPVDANQELSDSLFAIQEEELRIRYSKNSTYSKASAGSDQVNAIESHVSVLPVQLPVSLPMPAFCRLDSL